MTDHKNNNLISNQNTHVYIQALDSKLGIVQNDYKLIVEELKIRKISYTLLETINELFSIDRNDIIIGDFEWTRYALNKLNIKFPSPPDYPECLNHLLYRKIHQSTLGEVYDKLLSGEISETNPVYIKPYDTAKEFAAFCEPSRNNFEDIQNLIFGVEYLNDPKPLSTKIYCSEKLNDLLSEYRVYIVNGEIRPICPYLRKHNDEDLKKLYGLTYDHVHTHLNINMNIINDAVHRFAITPEGKNVTTGCAMDFGILFDCQNKKFENMFN